MAPAEVGGLETVVRLLSRGQRLQGDSVTVVAVVEATVQDSAFVAALESDGTPAEVIHVSARGYWHEWRVVRRLCKAEKPDIVHSHGYRPDIVDSMAARSIGIKTVTTVHGFTGGGLRNRLNERLQVRSLRRFAGVVAVSQHMTERLRRAGVPGSRIHVIPNAYDRSRPLIERSLARERLGQTVDGEFLVGWVGRLSREKGPDVLIDALSRLSGKGVRVVMIGDGPERRAIEARASALGIGDMIRWLGSVADAGALFPAFDAFVLSSRTEGIPVVLLEAMAAGVPIIATSAGGVPEMLSESEARLVPVENPEALAAAMTDVRMNRAAAQVRAVAARSRLDRDFAFEAWVRRYDRLYRSLSGNRTE